MQINQITKTTLPLSRLVVIWAAMRGDKDAQGAVTVGDVEQFEPAETFAEFLTVNDLPAFEEVLR